mgnify:CR=1 FL=1
MAEKELKLIDRKSAPKFPMGFRFGAIGEICIIDFIDIPNDTGNVFSSIAITKDQAKDLVENLSKFINNERNEDDQSE